MFAGTGLAFISLALFLVFNGAIVELILRTGDVSVRDLVRNTLRKR